MIHDHNFKVLRVANVETSCTSHNELRQPQQLLGGHAGLDLLHFDSLQASYPSPPILYPIIQSLFKRHQVTKSFPKSAEIFSPGYQIYQIQRSQVSRLDKTWSRECQKKKRTHILNDPKTIALKASHKDRAILRRGEEKSQGDCMIEFGLGLSGSKCTERDKRKQKQWQ